MGRQLALFSPEAPTMTPCSQTRLRADDDDDAASEAEELPSLPLTRAECDSVPRPCPFVSCKHHLFFDIARRTPQTEPDELPPDRSCALDIAAAGGVTLDEVAAAMGISRERARQIELVSLAKLRRKLASWNDTDARVSDAASAMLLDSWEE